MYIYFIESLNSPSKLPANSPVMVSHDSNSSFITQK